MQILRLVEAGRVDKIIAFDELPERLLKGVTLNDIEGLPRHWRDTAKYVEEKIQASKEEWVTRKKWCHYILEYKDINKDKERWEEITNFAKKACDLSQRLTEKLEDMAKDMAPDSHQQLALEPEDVPVVHIPIQYQEKIVSSNGAPITAIKEEIKPEPKEEKVNKDWTCATCGKILPYGRGKFMHSKSHETKKLVTA